MNIQNVGRSLLVTIAMALALGDPCRAQAQVRTTLGLVQGTASASDSVRTFRGIPYAAPPVGDLRWRAPSQPAAWSGVRDATAFGARCSQAPIFSDMIFRDAVNEDCLYLNVWTPARDAREAAGDGVDLWRRLCRRIGVGTTSGR